MQYIEQKSAKDMIESRTKYFKASDFSCECCGYYFMDENLVMALDHLRDRFGHPLTIKSAYRCQQQNLLDKGAKDSMHKVGKAVDLKVSTMSSDKLMKLVRLALADYSHLNLSRFNGFGMGNNTFHIDIRGEAKAWTYTAYNKFVNDKYSSWQIDFTISLVTLFQTLQPNTARSSFL